MSLTVLIFAIVLSFTLYQLVAIAMNLREIRRLREIRLSTRTQLSFGKLRHQLMMLAARDEIDTRSATFLNFYMINSAVMRNPDRYRSLADLVRRSFLEDIHDTNDRSVIERLNNESEAWSSDVKELVSKNGEAMFFLMVSHSPLFRSLYSLSVMIRRILFFLIQREFVLLLGAIKTLGRFTTEANRTFLKAEEEMKGLAA